MTHQKTALITGASSGIGLELAKLMAQDYERLVLVARDEKKLQEVAKALEGDYGIHVVVLAQDLAKPGSAQEVFEYCQQHHLAVETLVNNAGFGLYGEFSTTNLQTEQEMIQVNVIALTELTKYFLSHFLKQNNGKILNVASTAAFQAGPLMAVYYATKAYVLSFSEALAEEVRKTGVSVTALCPGPTATRFAQRGKLSSSSLFHGNTNSAEEVAKVGYRALKAGKTFVIPGLKNRFFVFAERFLPRKTVVRAVRYIQRKV